MSAGIWYVTAARVKVDLAAAVTGGVATAGIYRLRTYTSTPNESVTLWATMGQRVAPDALAAAVREQNAAAVPAVYVPRRDPAVPTASYVTRGGGSSSSTAPAWWVNLKDFGAAIDGTTDDTAAIQTWMNYCATNGRVAFHPGGMARHGALEVPLGLKMKGVSAGGYGILPGNTQQSRFAVIAGLNATAWHGAAGVAHVRFEDIHFDGNKNNNTAGDLFHLDDVALASAEEAQWSWVNCFLDSGAGYNIYIGTGRRACKIERCTVSYARLSGIRMNGSDSHVHHNIIGSNLTHGIEVGASLTRITSNDIYGNGTVGDANTGTGIVVLSTITQVTISGNGIDRNRRHGISISPSADAVTIIGNDLHFNSQESNGVGHNIFISTTTGGIAIIGNVFGTDSTGVSGTVSYHVFFNAAGATCDAWGNVSTPQSSNLGFSNDPLRCLNGTSSVGAQWAFARQAPALVATADVRTASGASAMSGANQARGGRVIMPRTGFLRDLAIWIVTASGNVDVGIFDTAGTTRTKLWSSGSIACPAAGAWAIVGDPNLAVTAGQQLDLVIAIDNVTATFTRVSTGNWTSLPTGFHPSASGGKPILAWTSAVSAFPLPTTLTEANLSSSGTLPLIIGRIS